MISISISTVAAGEMPGVTRERRRVASSSDMSCWLWKHDKRSDAAQELRSGSVGDGIWKL